MQSQLKGKIQLNIRLNIRIVCFLYVCFSVLFYSVNGICYIPRVKTILIKTAKNHGNTPYLVKQDLRFQTGVQTITVKESWYILDDSHFLMVAEGPGANLHITKLYKEQKILSFGIDGNLEQTKLQDDFFENYFYLRSSEKMAKRLIHFQLVPSNVLASHKYHLPNNNNTNNTSPIYKSEEFVRLARVAGKTAYAITGSSSSPGLWIEQDQFHILKLRLPSMVEVEASDYFQTQNGFWFPKIKTVKWDKNIVQIKVSTKVDVLNESTAKEKVSIQYLQSLHRHASKPTQGVVLDFYERFR